MVKPIDERFPTIVVQVLSRTEIEPGIELVDNCERSCREAEIEAGGGDQLQVAHLQFVAINTRRRHRSLTVPIPVDGVQTYCVCPRDILVALPEAKGQHEDRQRSSKHALRHRSHSAANLNGTHGEEGLAMPPLDFSPPTVLFLLYAVVTVRLLQISTSSAPLPASRARLLASAFYSRPYII